MPVTMQQGARVRFACSGCEYVIRVPTSHTGRKGKCPRCKGLVRVPGVRPCKPDIDETEPVDTTSAWIAAEAIESRSSGRSLAPGGGSDSGRRAAAAVDATEPVAARARVERSDTSTSAADAAVVGGLVIMVVAALWFFGGLVADVDFIYAPVMFGLGAVALAKGLIAPPPVTAS